MSIDKKDLERLYAKQRKNMRLRIEMEQKQYLENLRDDLINKPLPGQTKEEKEENRRRLLNYVQRYVFLKNLEPLDPTDQKDILKTNVSFDDSNKVKNVLGYLLLVRDFLNGFLKLRTFVMLASALFFFLIEIWIHYYAPFSLKDVNISFQNIIEKFPPYC